MTSPSEEPRFLGEWSAILNQAPYQLSLYQRPEGEGVEPPIIRNGFDYSGMMLVIKGFNDDALAAVWELVHWCRSGIMVGARGGDVLVFGDLIKFSEAAIEKGLVPMAMQGVKSKLESLAVPSSVVAQTALQRAQARWGVAP